MAQLKDSIVQGSLRVTDTTYTTNIVITGSQDAKKVLAAPNAAAGAPTWRTLSNSDVGLGNVTNDAQIKASVLTATGDMIFRNSSGVPARLQIGTAGQFLKATTSGPTWANTTDITSLGTVTTGTWSADTIAANKGGTGQSQYTIGDILYASSTSALSKLAGNTTTANKFLRSVATTNGTAVAPTWETLVSADMPSSVLRAYTRDEIGLSPNYDDPNANGIFEARSSSETTGESGTKPYNGFYPILTTKATNVIMQLAGANSIGWWIRGKQSANVTLADVAWDRILTDNMTDSQASANTIVKRDSGGRVLGTACYIYTTDLPTWNQVLYWENKFTDQGNVSTQCCALSFSQIGNTTTEGGVNLTLGNNLTSTAAGNSTGRIMLYHGSGGYGLMAGAYMQMYPIDTSQPYYDSVSISNVYTNRLRTRYWIYSQDAIYCQKFISIGPQNTTTEGGEVRLAAAPSKSSNDAILDVYYNTSSSVVSWRVVSNSTTRFYVNLANGQHSDYAEERAADSNQPGRVYKEQDNCVLTLANERLIPGCSILSDTFGTVIPGKNKKDVPIAVSGRVLAYPYQNRNNYHAGMAVCSAPNGTVDIMTREEIKEYPDCILGYVAGIPDEKTWSDEEILLNGRIWIRLV